MPQLRSGARLRPALAAELLFALLVVGTVAAFFLTTRVKREAPVVEGLRFDSHLSPNGDGRHDITDISFRIKRDDEVSVSILDADGNEVREVAVDRSVEKGRHAFRWNGRTDSGRVAADGAYEVRIGLRRQGRSLTAQRRVFVDTEPPVPVVRSVSPAFISPDGAGGSERATLVFDGPRRSIPTLLVYRTDAAKPRLVAQRRGVRDTGRLTWDGRVGPPGRRHPAAPGGYAMLVRIADAAGNVGPPRLPPVRGDVPGHPGVVVRYVSAVPPAAPVAAGAVASFQIQAEGRRYRWSLRRLGSSRSVARGRSRAATLRVRAPKGRSGVLVLRLEVGGHRYFTPFAVQGPRRRAVLLVLPATTWEARNELDSDRDGFPDVLPAQSAVALRRPLLGRGLPALFTSEIAPLLLDLDAKRRRFDVTTDLALARAGARIPRRYKGVLFAGSPRFYTAGAARLARSFVQGGGTLCWVGTDGFTREVSLSPKTVDLAGRRTSLAGNVFGERLSPNRSGGPLTVLGDSIGFFAGFGSLGSFPALERSAAAPRGARLLASAGDRPGQPALTVYGLGRGTLVRVGVRGFGRAARSSPVVARIMRSLWTSLSR